MEIVLWTFLVKRSVGKLTLKVLFIVLVWYDKEDLEFVICVFMYKVSYI